MNWLNSIYMRYILCIVALCVTLCASAQNIDRVKQELLKSSIEGSYVNVMEDNGTKEAVRVVETQRRSKEANGFRIVIFSNNGQYAGDNADKVLQEFKTLYPQINAYLVYESPYFKVSVGDCLSMEEAQILMATILPNYPKAFPRRENIKLEALTTCLTPHIEPADSLAVAPYLVE